MIYKKLDIYDYSILILVLIISIAIGLYHGFKRKIRTILRLDTKENESNKLAEYLSAGSSMGSIPIGFSLLVSLFSATSILGIPAEIYQYGSQYYISVLGMISSPIIGAYITGPFFTRLNIISVFEYLEMRFQSKTVRQVGTFCYLVKNFISCSIFIYGPASTLNLFTGLNDTFAIVLVGVIGTFYTTVGGIRAVIWADFFQAGIMFLSLLMIIIKGIYDAGGISEILKISNLGGRLDFIDLNPDPFIRQSLWPLVIGTNIYFHAFYCIEQQMLQRFKAAKTIKQAQTALLINIPGIVVIISMCSFCGLILYANFVGCDPLASKQINNPNQLMVYFVQNHLSSYACASGLFLASLFCGSLSSVSSVLNSLSAIIWKDFLNEFSYFKNLKDSKSVKITKSISLACGILSTLLAIIISQMSGNITNLSFRLNGAFFAPILGLFMLGSLFTFTNSKGALCGTVSSFLFVVWIVIGSHIVKPIYPKLPVSTDSCNLTQPLTNLTLIATSLTSPSITNTHSSGIMYKIYSLSYMWYQTTGIIVLLIVGIITSIFTGGNDFKVDKSLYLYDLFPFINKKLNTKISSLDSKNFYF